jgi:hypothetical protein
MTASAASGTDVEFGGRVADRGPRTKLAEALTATLRAEFPTILHLSADRTGNILATPHGLKTFEGYAQITFGADDQAAGEAEHALGQILGTLNGDLLKAARDGGADLRRDFGAASFGDRRVAQGNAAETLGELIEATRAGIERLATVSDVSPEQHAAQERRIERFDERERDFSGSLSRFRPNRDLVNRLTRGRVLASQAIETSEH